MQPHPASDLPARLRAAGIQPSAQRLAVAGYVLFTKDHPSADQVLEEMERRGKKGKGVLMISRATIYNTLNLFVKKGLLKELTIEEGHALFDPRLDAHHHFLDTSTGEIVDLPYDAIPLGPLPPLDGFHIDDVQVVIRGTRRNVRPVSDARRRTGGRRSGPSVARG